MSTRHAQQGSYGDGSGGCRRHRVSWPRERCWKIQLTFEGPPPPLAQLCQEETKLWAKIHSISVQFRSLTSSSRALRGNWHDGVCNRCFRRRKSPACVGCCDWQSNQIHVDVSCEALCAASVSIQHPCIFVSCLATQMRLSSFQSSVLSFSDCKCRTMTHAKTSNLISFRFHSRVRATS